MYAEEHMRASWLLPVRRPLRIRLSFLGGVPGAIGISSALMAMHVRGVREPESPHGWARRAPALCNRGANSGNYNLQQTQ
jgi:hypothetical protein